MVFMLTAEISGAIDILCRLSKEDCSPEKINPKTSVEWFAASKFYREKIRMHQDDPEKFRRYLPWAVTSFMRADNPYSAKKIVAVAARKSIELGKKDFLLEVLGLLKLLDFDVSEDVFLAMLDGYLAFHIHSAEEIIEKIIKEWTPSSEHLYKIVKLILSYLLEEDIDRIMEILRPIKEYDYQVYYVVLGELLGEKITSTPNYLRRFMEIIDREHIMHVAILLLGITRIENIPINIVKIILRKVIESGGSDEIRIASMAVLRLLEKISLDDDVANIIGALIQRLYGYNMNNELINVTAKYAISLIPKDINSSQIYLDVAINMCYVTNDIESISLIYEEYIRALAKEKRFGLIRKILPRIYREVRLGRKQSAEIWMTLVSRISNEEQLRELEAVYRDVSRYIDNEVGEFIKSALLVGSIRFSKDDEAKVLIDKVLNLESPFFGIKMVKEVSKRLPRYLGYIARRILEQQYGDKFKAEIMYAVIVKLVEISDRETLREVIKMMRTSEAFVSKEIYASLLMETATLIMDMDEDTACDILMEAYKTFRNVGMMWMSLNALAILAAHREIEPKEVE